MASKAFREMIAWAEAKRSRGRGVCPHRGPRVGEKECKGCRGNVRLKLWQCALHNRAVTDPDCRAMRDSGLCDPAPADPTPQPDAEPAAVAPVEPEPPNLGVVLVVTAVYRAVNLFLEHSRSVVNGAPPGRIVYAVWDDNSPWPDAGRIHQWCVMHGARYFRADAYGVNGQGHMARGFNIIHDACPPSGMALVTESDCILPPDWYARYGAVAATLPTPQWGVLAGITVNEQHQVELPDLGRMRRQGLDLPTDPNTLLETDNTCLAGALVRDPRVVWFDPAWRFLNCSIALGGRARSLGLTNYLSPTLPIIHYPHSSREQLHQDRHRGRSRWTADLLAAERAGDA